MRTVALHSAADVGFTGIEHCKQLADALPPAPPAFRHMIDPCCYEGFERNAALACTGRVRAHCDDDFPQWAGIIILRCGKDALLRVLGADVPLRPGLAVTFDAHRRHSVNQALNDVLVWLPVYDKDEPIAADRLLAIAAQRFRPRLAA